MGRPAALGPLGRRLAAAFVVVALVALGSYALLTVLAERAGVGGLARTHRAVTAEAVVSVASNAYRASGGWAGADLGPVRVLADLSSAAARLSDQDGRVLFQTGSARLLTSARGAPVSRPVVVDGTVVGRVRLAFAPDGLTSPERRLRQALSNAAVLGVGVSVAVAVAAALAVSTFVVRPIRRLSAATAALGRGDRSVRVGASTGRGELSELGAVFDDMVTALDEADAARQAMIADVAHELRTPLAILQAETEALVDGVRPATPEALGSVHDETIRLGRIVGDLQALASAEAAGLSLERRRVDLATVAAEAADALAGRFESSGVGLERHLATAPVDGDPQRLHQVVVNLLTNAGKFTPEGGTVHLDVRVAGAAAELSVTDSGPGIPADEQGRVFQRFYRGSAGRHTAGTGIGLAVVAQLVHAHGGTVCVTTPAGGGARFTVSLPAATG